MIVMCYKDANIYNFYQGFELTLGMVNSWTLFRGVSIYICAATSWASLQTFVRYIYIYIYKI